jgi:hypothetical protein
LTLTIVRFGHAFLMETGASVGEIIGHNKVSGALSSSLVMNHVF